MINVTLTGDRDLVLKLHKMPVVVAATLSVTIKSLSLRLQAHIQRNKLSGQVLKVVTGALRRSVHATPVVHTGNVVRGGVSSSGDVKYAGIHEFGGRTKAHVIEPRKGKALAWMGKNGEMAFAKIVHHPGSVMPERSFMRSSLREMSSVISLEMKRSVVRGLLKAKAAGAPA